MKHTTEQKKWIKFRHRVVRRLLGAPVRLLARCLYGARVEPFRGSEKRQYLVVMNHQTAFDQFFMGIAFRQPIYYVASEDLFSKGWVSSLIRYLVEPIPIKKQTNDVHAVITCLRVVREGGTIGLAPEGNRTYSGKTEYIKPSVVKLVRKMGLPLAVFRIEGGYGVQPRWSDSVRRGRIRAYVSRVVEPEEYAALSDEELYDLICRELSVDEAAVTGEFRHKKLAEYLERAVYVCPYCGLSVFESKGDRITCTNCRRQIRYLPTKELKGIGFEFPFRFAAQWYAYQCDFVNRLDPAQYTQQPLFTDRVELSEVILYKNKRLLASGSVATLYGDRVTVSNLPEGVEAPDVFPFEEVSAVTVLGRNKVNFYHKGRVWQLKGDKRFNAVKYVNLFYRFKNVTEGKPDGKFLGL